MLASILTFSSGPDAQTGPSPTGQLRLWQQVEQSLVDPITEGRRHILRAVTQQLSGADSAHCNDYALSTPLHVSQHLLPAATILRRLSSQPLDLATLLNTPEDLFAAEGTGMWADTGGAAEYDARMLAQALQRAGELFDTLTARKQDVREDNVDEKGSVRDEDAVERELRLNLIALAKRAPLDQIARLPAELVPLHLRHVVPTIIVDGK